MKKRGIISLFVVFLILIGVIFINSIVLAEETTNVYEFDYTGEEQTFTVPKTGYYKVELWGASGSSTLSETETGKGGYTSGDIYLKEGQKLYVYVGERGDTNRTVKFNGGGYGGLSENNSPSNSGGGATDIRLVQGAWDDFESLKSRIMVAAGSGGGAGHSDYESAGERSNAGGLQGYAGGYYSGHAYTNQNGKGGTQLVGGAAGVNLYASGETYSGTFGKGGNSENSSSSFGSGGGGGGYYGGGAGGGTSQGGVGQGAGGGSSFISGHEGCNAIAESSTEGNIKQTNQNLHYSGLYFNKTKMIDGAGYNWTTEKETEVIGMPTHDGTRTMIGNIGNGYAKITYYNEVQKNSLTSLVSSKGTLSPEFNSTEHNYTLNLTSKERNFSLTGTTEEGTEVIGLNKEYTVKPGKTEEISVVLTYLEDGTVEIYNINATREGLTEGEHSAELSYLAIENYENSLSPEFNPSTKEYEIVLKSGLENAKVIVEQLDEEATVTIEGADTLAISGTITITVSHAGLEDVVYKINYYAIEKMKAGFSYTGGEQTFTVPKTGYYKVELWGAQGGNASASKGAYTSGIIKLSKSEKLYIYVGEGNSSVENGTSFNGGTGSSGGTGGGGATDIRLTPGTWNDFNSLKSRIMVAAGSGSGQGNSNINLGYGGTLVGGSSGTKGGAQTSAGARELDIYLESGFGYASGGCAGGGGYYGGGAASCSNGAGGGSSFISGYKECDAISEESTSGNIIHTGQNKHYSGKAFIAATMIAGNETMPTQDGTSTMIGNTGNGYAKISYLKEIKKGGLISLVSSKGTLSPEFNSTEHNYTLNLTSKERNFSLTGTTEEGTEVIGLNKEYTVKPGKTEEISVVLTYLEDGTVEIYNINATREGLTEGEHSTELSYLAIENYEDGLDPKFSTKRTEYFVYFQYGLTSVNIKAETFDSEATVTVDGADALSESGTITITVSLPEEYGVENTIYTIKYEAIEGMVKDYGCSGGVQSFVAPVSGTYKLETWGAQGGSYSSGTAVGGYGGYSQGDVHLNKGDTLYIYVGGAGVISAKGSYTSGGYNGGGASSKGYQMASGGGATDMRIQGNSLYNRLIVAGGGGGGAYYSSTRVTNGASGGGAYGGDGVDSGTASQNYGGSGGTQTSGGTAIAVNTSCPGVAKNYNPGSFGQGGSGYTGGTTCAGAGGGGGWYGGGAGNAQGGSGGGGSGYVLTASSYKPSGYQVSSEYYLNNAGTTNGVQPGNGYARITMLSYEAISHDNDLKILKSDRGALSPEFSYDETEYELVLDKSDRYFTLTGETSSEKATVTGLGKYMVKYNEIKTVEIMVTSESGDVKVYAVNAKRKKLGEGEHSSKLADLDIKYYEEKLNPEFNSEVTEYSLKIFKEEIDLIIDAVPFDNEATKEINGADLLLGETGTVIITVTSPIDASDKTIYKINYEKTDIEGEPVSYNYTGEIQEFVAPRGGKYKVELWGAKGSTGNISGNGGYTRGRISLKSGEKIYINVGGSGDSGGYNGGGLGAINKGGGATDVRLEVDENKTWNNFESLKSRIMVAAGGGGHYGQDVTTTSAAAGGLSGYTGSRYTAAGTVEGQGGTQTAGGVGSEYSGGFGYGGQGEAYSYDGHLGGSGGGGYYGGGGAYWHAQGGGGSSYISGHEGCDAISEGSVEGNIIHTGQSVHYSGKEFEQTKMIDGAGYSWTREKGTEVIGMPTYDGTNTMTGNTGDGHAKITLNGVLSKNNYLQEIVVTNKETKEKKEFEEEYNPTTEEYHVTVGVEETEIKIEARPEGKVEGIEGLGDHEVKAGENIYNILVTAESGDIRTYRVIVKREASNVSTVKNIEITGLVDTICSRGEEYCKLAPQFSEEYNGENIYEMIVPAGIREVEFTVYKRHKYQTVIGDGVVKLEPWENTIAIEVESEDGASRTAYTFEITRDMTGDNYIDALKIIEPEKEIDFNYLVQDYGIKVENEIEAIKMQVILDDPEASYEVKEIKEIEEETGLVIEKAGEIVTVSGLKTGDNRINIEVTAVNGEIRNYVIDVYRLSNGNPLLRNIKVTKGEEEILLSPEFRNITRDYGIIVENEVEKIKVEAEAEASTTSITYVGSTTGEYNIRVGLQLIKIVTTAEDGSVETYRITVTRKGNSNTNLSSVEVSEGGINPSFEKGTKRYSMRVGASVESLTINAVAEAETSKVEIINNKLKVNETTEVQIKVTAENGDIGYYYIDVYREGSDNNYLSSLTVNGVLVEGFEKTKETYSMTVENEVKKATIGATAEDGLVKSITGRGDHSLTAGNNTISVTVTSQTGKKRTYKIKIFRKYNSDGSIKNIKVSKGSLSPEFSAETHEYTVNVGNEVTSIRITGVATKTTTKVEGNGVKSLREGENEYTIYGVAQDGVTKSAEYKIKVIRDRKESVNLKRLIVKEGSLNQEFDPMVINYEVKVPNEIEEVNIIGEAEDERASVTIAEEERTGLEVGENTVRITVTSVSGITKTYEVKVIRQEKASTDLHLRVLDVTSCNIGFEREIPYYECEVENEVGKVTVSAQAESELNVIEGLGEKELKVGDNILVVRVISPEGIYKDYQVLVNRKESKDTTLKVLKDKSISFQEVYEPNKREYHITVKEDKLDIKYTKNHEGQTVKIMGNENFVVGENTVIVRVTAANGVDTGDYVIHVTKEKSDNTYLKSLKVGTALSPSFSKGVTSYKAKVAYKVGSVTVRAEAESKYAKVTGTGTYSLEVGENEIEVKVEAEDGSTRSYIIVVTRKANPNNYLKNLEVEGYTLNKTFAKKTTSYSIEVENYRVRSIIIRAEAEDAEAIVSGTGTRELKIGKDNQVIKVKVQAADGNIREYKITVKVKDKTTSLLKNIKIKNYKLDKTFESEELEYIVIVDNEITSLSSTDVTVEKLDPNGSYTIEGNSGFKVGEDNQLKIISKSSDGAETTTYILHIERQAYSNTYLSGLTVNEGELSPEFNKTNLMYTVEVGYEIEKIKIKGTPEISTNKVSGTGEKSLEVGENEYAIVVTSSTNKNIKRTYYVTVKRKGSSEAGIESITSTLGEVTKVDEIHYKLEVEKGTEEVREGDITVTPKDKLAEVQKEEVIILRENNIYHVKVISPDVSTEKNYEIEVVEEQSGNTKLKTLTASKGTLEPVYDKEVREYTLNVLSNEKEVELFAETEETTSEILNEDLIYELEEYTTEAQISVQAEDGTIGIYLIKIEKSVAVERGASDIKITGVKEVCSSCILPTFSETTYEYTMTYPYEVKEIGIEVTKKHQNQKVKIYKNEVEVQEPYKLDLGENIYRVEIENGVGEKVSYTYTIKRLEADNNYLKSLKLISPEQEIEGFSKEKDTYYASVGYEYEEVGIEAIAEDALNATVEITGNKYLLEGKSNEVEIKVTAGNGKIRKYKIYITRRPETNNLLKTLTISSGEIYELTPKFVPGVTEYSLEVASVISKVKIDALPDSEEAKVKMIDQNGVATEGTSREYDLELGQQNVMTIQVIAVDKQGEEQTREYKIRITRREGKSIYLEKLEVINGEMAEEFKKDVMLYHVTVENTVKELEIKYTAEDENAVVEIRDNKITSKTNTVKIVVTNPNTAAINTYVLEVTRKGDKNNYLKSLRIREEEGNIEGFSKEKQEYELKVENKESYIAIEAEAESEEAKVTIKKEGEQGEEGTKKTISLKAGENVIKIVVDPGDEETEEREYTIKIIREENSYLKGIVTDRGEVSPTFEKDKYEYSIEVENKVKDITVLGEKEDEKAVVEGNGKYELKVGETKIALKVTNNGSEKTYTITVIRKGNDNNYLKYLTIGEGILSPAFEKETESYVIEIPNTKTKLTMEYAAEDEEAKVEEIGNENFTEEEETVTIKVTSTSGKIREYKITVKRLDPKLFKAELLNLKVTPGTLSPTYKKDTKIYTVKVGSKVEAVEIAVVKEYKEQKVEGDGRRSLSGERTELQVKVTGRGGEIGLYTVVVIRGDVDDPRLSALEFNEGKLKETFIKSRYGYTLEIDSDVKMLSFKKLEPVAYGAKIKVEPENLTVTETLKKITIEVTSPVRESNKKTYTVTVKKVKSSNTNLKELKSNLGVLSPEFDKAREGAYTLTVGEEIESIELTAVTESDKAYINSGGNRLEEIYNVKENNKIEFVVTSEIGTTRSYTILINRVKEDNAKLKKLVVKGKEISPEFKKDVYAYEVEVYEEDKEIEIEAEAEKAGTKINGLTGAYEEKVEVEKGEAKLVTTSEGGSTETYVIKIKKPEKISSKLKSLEVREGTLNPIFNKEKIEYSILVPNEIEGLTLRYEPEEEGAKVEVIGNENLEVGVSKEVIIKVTSRKDESKVTEYKLNVTRQISSNTYLRSLTVNKGEIEPGFNKEEFEYRVEIGNEEEDIEIKGEAESETASVILLKELEEIGNPVGVTVGANQIVVRVKDNNTNVIRDYKVQVTRKKNNNTNLKSLVVDKGELTPSFTKEETNYTLKVEEGTEEIEIKGEAEVDTSRVSGSGKKEIKVGSQEIKVRVTAEDGSIKDYKITVERKAGTSTDVEDIVPSTGILEPAFDNTKNEGYKVKVDSDTNVISFEVKGVSKTTKVEGNKDIALVGEETEVIITLTAEDGRIREIKIVVERKTKATEIKVTETGAMIGEGEEYQIEAEVLPAGASGEIEYVIDEEAKEIIEVGATGKVTGKKVGEAVVKVRLKEDTRIEKEVTIKVILKDIRSQVYEVEEKEEETGKVKIITGMEVGESLEELLENMDNESSTIKIYNGRGEEIVNYQERVRTGIKMKLEIEGEIYDEVLIILRGDIAVNEDGEGDGNVDPTDSEVLLDHTLQQKLITGNNKYAADLDRSGKIEANDNQRILDYLQQQITTLN